MGEHFQSKQFQSKNLGRAKTGTYSALLISLVRKHGCGAFLKAQGSGENKLHQMTVNFQSAHFLPENSPRARST